MSHFWQAKIWGLLHDPALKALHFNVEDSTDCSLNTFWQDLAVMQEWRNNDWNPEKSTGTALKHIHLANYITSASDRAAIGSLSESINYAPASNQNFGLEITHLLSGKTQEFKLRDSQHQALIAESNRTEYLNEKERSLFSHIQDVSDRKKVFWWLWRCFPKAVCNEFAQQDELLLMPAETRLPDASIWSHASLTAAVAGALAGYDLTSEEIKEWPFGKNPSRPYLATFSFSPIQELIKASRKMRDFWAGSWTLHYLSAKICWKLAQQYGPDSLVYPSLFQQPLIDDWILQEWPDFQQWVKKPSPRQLLTAGFPNVLVLVLPQNRVEAAMKTARQTLLEEWKKLGKSVFDYLQKPDAPSQPWMPDLEYGSSTWEKWLSSQWQTYWSALPIGEIGQPLHSSAIDCNSDDRPWRDAQNLACNLSEKQALFPQQELDFLQAAAALRQIPDRQYPFNTNVGSWWPYVFDQMRFSLNAIKNARTWAIPTAFGDRSTISGLGSVVHPDNYKQRKDWITEGDTKQLWKRQVGLFDGIEKLNATETVKRGLHKILPQILSLRQDQIAASYPDLTAGVAGYLKVHPGDRPHFVRACQAILDSFNWAEAVIQEMEHKWGIPFADEDNSSQKYHPRLLNTGWLIEDAESEKPDTVRTELQTLISQYYPNNNPADWYVIAAGDGDSMSEWLKGKPLKNYNDYIPEELKQRLKEPIDALNSSQIEPEVRNKFQNFLDSQKRMGPSTHGALSRALLDFSNQLVPYLTEQRYAGRLIYGGGDDVLAYTNLWEWDSWLWDIRQCFRGVNDPKDEFISQGDYWRWNGEELPKHLSERPLFTMGHKATISFGIVIAHHSVPMAITLENLWESEEEAKEHRSPDRKQKDAVQVRVLYGNGNILKATAKFEVFNQWRSLVSIPELDCAIFEQAAEVWSQHPAPIDGAIAPWTKAFCSRREAFKGEELMLQQFQEALSDFIKALWVTTEAGKECDRQINNWLKLAAFLIRNRAIKLGGESQ
jgi:CRISPR-associated protein Cmr2